jgi:hypothetical protein
MEHGEIAAFTGGSEGNSKSQHFKGLGRAKKIMDDLETGNMNETPEPISEPVADPAPPPAVTAAKPRCAPCQEQNRFRFADTEVGNVPMCTWCARQGGEGVSPAPATRKRAGSLSWSDVLHRCGQIVPGASAAFEPPPSHSAQKYRTLLSARLSQERSLSIYQWSTSLTEKPGFVVVKNCGRRSGEQAPAHRAALTPSPRHFPVEPKPVLNGNAAALVTVRVPVTALDKIEQMMHDAWAKRTPEEKAVAAEKLLTML